MHAAARLLLALLLCSGESLAAGPGARPNVVVFISDDHSQRDSEPYGSTEVRTPHLARLAAEGMRFTHAFVASPACGPSRAALLTGLWPARNGAEPNHKNKRADVAPLPPRLKQLGYEVAAIGKVAHGNFATSYGFDHVAGPNRGITTTDAVREFLDRRDARQPLCLFVGTRHPHVPWTDTPTYDVALVQIPPTHLDTRETREQRTSYLTDVSASDRLLEKSASWSAPGCRAIRCSSTPPTTGRNGPSASGICMTREPACRSLPSGRITFRPARPAMR